MNLITLKKKLFLQLIRKISVLTHFYWFPFWEHRATNGKNALLPEKASSVCLIDKILMQPSEYIISLQNARRPRQMRACLCRARMQQQRRNSESNKKGAHGNQITLLWVHFIGEVKKQWHHEGPFMDGGCGSALVTRSIGAAHAAKVRDRPVGCLPARPASCTALSPSSGPSLSVGALGSCAATLTNYIKNVHEKSDWFERKISSCFEIHHAVWRPRPGCLCIQGAAPAQLLAPPGKFSSVWSKFIQIMLLLPPWMDVWLCLFGRERHPPRMLISAWCAGCLMMCNCLLHALHCET